MASREDLDEQVAAFLEAGGTIKQCTAEDNVLKDGKALNPVSLPADEREARKRYVQAIPAPRSRA